MRALFLIALILTVATSPAHAARYTFDKAHTSITFFVDHLGFSMSQGEFDRFDGHFIFNPADPKNSSVEVTIDTASIDMDDEKWNAHMRGADFLDTENHPEMTFKSEMIEIQSNNTGRIHGQLTLLGITKPVVLDVTHNRSGKHAFNNKYVSGFSATARLARSEWGMEYALPLIGDEVEIRIEVEGFRDEKTVIE